MNVTWLAHRDPLHPLAGGAELDIIEIGKRLVKRSHRVRLITTRLSTQPARETVEGIEIIRLGGNLTTHLAPLFLADVTQTTDIVVDDLGHAVPWGTPWLSRLPGTAFFHHLHARTLPGQVNRPLRLLIGAAEREYARVYRGWTFVAESQSSTSDLIGLGILREQITQILPGVDSEVFIPGQKADHPRAIYFGGLRRYKRPEHALLILRRLVAVDPSSELLIAGSGPLMSDLRRYARDLGVEGQTHFLGRLLREDLAKVLGTCWFNIHCSVAEGWGFSALEAAAAAVPTVGYRVPGLTESVAEGKSGFLVDDGLPDALFEAAMKIVLNRDEMAKSARAFALTFPWNLTADRWEQHLSKQLLKSTG